MQVLQWPEEKVCRSKNDAASWFHAGSNYCLDFHGDPLRSELVVYSDGNHHMALQQALESFRAQRGLESIFYCTLPPGVYLQLMRQGYLELGNLRISNYPDLVIGPDTIVDGLLADGKVHDSKPFVKSAGNALLVAKGNPHGIDSIADLFAAGVRLFISNPVSETASFAVYRNHISAVARRAAVDESEIEHRFARGNADTVFGERIHHREAPAAIAAGNADVALLYRHLALRYVRTFPDLFEMVEAADNQAAQTTVYHYGRVDPANTLADELGRFLLVEEVRDIYEYHGLSRL
jgi:hypothetical protein